VTRKQGWEDSSTGPDWIDVETMMRALGALHSAGLELTVAPRGTGFSGGVTLMAHAKFERLPGSSLPEMVTAADIWPGSKAKTFVGAMYNLLYELDYRISQVYKQEALWS